MNNDADVEMGDVKVTDPLPESAVIEHQQPDGDVNVFDASARPRTRGGHDITAVKDRSGPAGLCCFNHSFYPTHALIAVGGDGDRDKSKEVYEWNSRGHRKMRFPVHAPEDRDKMHHPASKRMRFRLLSWEPRNVTWHICWVGVIANTLWVVNGVYAVWPDHAKSEMGGINIPYYTGVIGAMLFIVTGYLGYVEAINHTHEEVRIPPPPEQQEEQDHDQRLVRRQLPDYGLDHNPLDLALGKGVPDGHHGHGGVLRSASVRTQLIAEGYPLVQDVGTGSLLTSRLYDNILERYSSDIQVMGRAVVGRLLDVRVRGHTIRVRVESLLDGKDDGKEAQGSDNKSAVEGSVQALEGPDWPGTPGYRWWTNAPDLHHIGILNALVFFVATIIFWIPAVAWWPMDKNGNASQAATIFWVYVLQIIPSLGFVYVGHAAMAEASGSWIKPDFNSIGWWISFWNTIGGYGFLLYPILALPGVVGEPGCCDNLTKWGAAMATFWGSCSFWVAGILQCAEFSSEHPITLGGRRGGKIEEKKME